MIRRFIQLSMLGAVGALGALGALALLRRKARPYLETDGAVSWEIKS
jgi:hypothetical protein